MGDRHGCTAGEVAPPRTLGEDERLTVDVVEAYRHPQGTPGTTAGELDQSLAPDAPNRVTGL
ncbi:MULTISPECIES: hypothetical protein [Rhodococcus]|uniref:Uncharacterized protein n=1 Tax=Rhodococcus oxybenzonivorans TaxID=1990687 RepID=A0AAE5A7K8_9NOCA|nr:MULTISPECIES: hypothetical protein [Rhodococcus]MDV7242232.1 hypothetical protein [Rhodococcus oxybenzonivorans]MDV7266616.1 hypothetical protein [Rhodococcus oxybenzonivorans]MDV7276273.1 hypothetical protein [Rhodococcus oxybenzonivorans]MDV7331720.1 hypothetical protein [Rhodococcus oxybenzonivorans]MDV7343942.1 hypothetical protein [Rhodococcus oxybenzonivorans]